MLGGYLGWTSPGGWLVPGVSVRCAFVRVPERFGELAAALADGTDTRGAARLRALVTSYLAFAERHPATYEAMFRLPIGARFASADTPPELSAGFTAIVDALATLDAPPSDLGTAAEVLWGAMHGLATLTRAGRFRPEHHERRVDELVRTFTV